MYFSTCLQPLFIFRYKLWHYTGKLLDERRVSELWEVKHLSLLMYAMIYAIEKTLNPLNFFGSLCQFFFWQVKWQPVPDGKFKEPTIDYSAAVSATTQEQQKSQCYCSLL